MSKIYSFIKSGKRKITVLQELVVVTLLFISICLIYKGQPRISYNEGKGWDGIYYYDMVEQIQSGSFPLSGKLPFIKRVGVQLLVGYFSNISGMDINDSALIINLSAIYIIVILLVFWLRKFIETPWIRLMMIFGFMMAWHVHLRLAFYNPVGTDNWGAVWLLAGLLMLNRLRETYNAISSFKFSEVIGFSLIVGIGVFFRETNSILAIAPFMILNPVTTTSLSGAMQKSEISRQFRRLVDTYFRPASLVLLIPLLVVVLANKLVSGLIQINDLDNYSYFSAASKTFYTKSLPEYLLGIFNAYGPLFVLLPFFRDQYKSFLLQRQELTFLLIISFVLGYVGAGGTERITFMSGFPILFILLAISVKTIFYTSQRWWLYILLFLQTIAYRFYWNVPDYPNETNHVPVPFLTLPGDQFPFLYLYSNYGSFLVNTVIFIEYCFLFILTMYILINKIQIRLPRLRQNQGKA